MYLTKVDKKSTYLPTLLVNKLNMQHKFQNKSQRSKDKILFKILIDFAPKRKVNYKISIYIDCFCDIGSHRFDIRLVNAISVFQKKSVFKMSKY